MIRLGLLSAQDTFHDTFHEEGTLAAAEAIW
jgi:hypothetical protein